MIETFQHRALEAERTETLKALDGFVTGLGYLK